MIFKLKKKKINLSYDNSKKKLRKYLFLFASLFVSHVFLFYSFEDRTLFESLWVTVISMTTIGYGDISAATTVGKIVTMILVTTGIFVLANTVDSFLEFRNDEKETKRKGIYKWNLSNHLIIANIPINYTIKDIVNLITNIREEFGNNKFIQIVNKSLNEEFLNEIYEIENVVFYKGLPSKQKTLEAINISKATDVIILTEIDDNDPDGYTFDIIHRIKENNPKINIVTQCLHSCNKERLINAGANSVVAPARIYPEIISRALSKNNIIIDFFEDIMTKEGNELNRIKLSKIISSKWENIIFSIMQEERGTPIGYVDKNKNLIIKPELYDYCEMSEIIIIEQENCNKTKTIEEILEV